MGVKIDISGTSISGNTKVLNGLKINGENDTDISVKKSSVSGKSQILNNVNISGNSSVNIGIENSRMKENSRVLNNLDIQRGKVNVELKDLSLGEGVEFMNDKKFTERTSHKETSNKSQQATYERDTTKTSEKKEGFLKRILKSILKSEDVEDNSKEEAYSSKTHEDFEGELSMGGKLKNLDISEAPHSDEEQKRKQRSTDRGR